MTLYSFKRTVRNLQLTDLEVGTYAAVIRRRMDAAAEIQAGGNVHLMPPMDDRIVELGRRIGFKECNNVMHWVTTAWEVLAEIASERFIEQNSQLVPR